MINFKDKCLNKLSKIYDSKIEVPALIFSIMLLGIFLRLHYYLFNRSLWLDETSLSVSIVSRDFWGLLQPLLYRQGAPIGFLYMEKISTLLFGNCEYALRLFPFVCGLASLILFYYLSKKTLSKSLVPVSLFIYATCYRLIYYAEELKPYSVDVLATVMILIFGLKMKDQELGRKYVLPYGILGILIVFCSHPSIFVITGVIVTLSVSNLLKKNKENLLNLIRLYAIILFGFIASYWLSVGYIIMRKSQETYWIDGYMPLTANVLEFMHWLKSLLFYNVSFLVSPEHPVFAVILLFVGIAIFLLKDKLTFFILISPVLVALIPSMLHVFALYDRLILFTAPIVIILIVKSLESCSDKLRWKNFIIIPVFIIFVFNTLPILKTTVLSNDMTKEESRSVVSFFEDNAKDNDIIYLSYCSNAPFQHYYDNSKKIRIVRATASWHMRIWPQKEKDARLHKLRGNKRVWIFFAHQREGEDEYYTNQLKKIGTLITRYRVKGSSIYLYDLSK